MASNIGSGELQPLDISIELDCERSIDKIQKVHIKSRAACPHQPARPGKVVSRMRDEVMGDNQWVNNRFRTTLTKSLRFRN